MDLRLFPLRTVLLPGMALPLEVFEQRYLQLVSECVDASEPFGVVLIREGEEVGTPATPHELGTTARIESVERGQHGRLQLRTVGERRFRIVTLYNDRPYLWAEVEYPADEATETPEPLMQRARESYSALVRLRLTASGEYLRDVPTPKTPGALADAVGAEVATISARPDELQGLLEAIDVRGRLVRALELMEVAIPVAQRQTRAAITRRSGGIARLS